MKYRSLVNVVALICVALGVVVTGCGQDPLVFDENGVMRSSLSAEEIEDAALPLMTIEDLADLEYLLLSSESGDVVVVEGSAIGMIASHESGTDDDSEQKQYETPYSLRGKDPTPEPM